MIVIKKIIEEHKKIIIICTILLLLTVCLFLMQTITSHTSNHKTVRGNDFVYTKETNTSKTGKISYLPVINLDFDGVSNYNTAIEKAYESSIAIEDNIVTYQYVVEKNILFLLIKFVYYDEKTKGLETIYKSFNIDLKNGKLLLNDDILKRFGYTNKDVSYSVEKTLRQYYKEGEKKMYIDTNMCDFSCFLYNHLINKENLSGAVSLYFENNELVIYRPFILNSVLDDKKVFPPNAFQMKIIKES